MMRLIHTFFPVLFILPLISFSQGTWTVRASLGSSGREMPSAFSCGDKGYVGLGSYGSTHLNDLWEYNTVTNSWSQKANYPGAPRRAGIGFAIGMKGYMGLGYDASTWYNDFYEYDPITNIWSVRANFGGAGRRFAAGAAVGGKGYVTCGDDGFPYESDLWEYNPTTDGWILKANFGTGLSGPGTFVMWGKIYVACGNDNSGNFSSNFLWEYDVNTDVWTQRANFTGPERRICTGFGNCGGGYIGGGWDGTTYFNDFYMYYPASNAWTTVASMPGSGRYGLISMNIAGIIYAGMGTGSSGPLNDFYKFEHCAFLGMEQGPSAEVLANNLSVFPNPATDLINVDLEKFSGVIELNIYDSRGALIGSHVLKAGSLQQLRLNLSPGMYFVVAEFESKILGHSRLLINK